LNTDSNPIAFWTLPSKYAVRMSNAQAAIIISQLSTYKAESHKRISKAILYNNGLIDIPNIVIPPLRLDGSHIYLYYCIQSENRDDLSHFVTVQLRDIQISHHRNCAALPCFSQFHRHCPNAEKAGNRVIYLPLYPSYDENQVLSNIRAIRDYYLVSVK
jgi:dTDP-4-amino-4,6-dideoxygalactose transaminase